MDRATLTQAVKDQARQLGFAAAGVCAAVTPPGIHRFQQWLTAGLAGQMRYLPDRAEAYRHPRHVMDAARSVVMLAMNYRTVTPLQAAPGQGQISCYAWGQTDYHDLVRDRLQQLAQYLRTEKPGCRVRGVVDTAPLLEREFAQLAGLGWIGKNTMLLSKELGSWFFLAALLTDVELQYDQPHRSDHCGTCRACLDACPTDAFPQPYVLDATRCISYLTIELRDAVPHGLRSGVGDWLFGCDICNAVCPWNRRAPQSTEAAFAPRAGSNPIDLAELFQLDDETFRARFGLTPLMRAQRRGLLRNAAMVLGNQKCPDTVPALVHGLQDAEPLVRAACAWALGQFPDVTTANDALRQRLAMETDDDVLAEINAALQTLD